MLLSYIKEHKATGLTTPRIWKWGAGESMFPGVCNKCPVTQKHPWLVWDQSEGPGHPAGLCCLHPSGDPGLNVSWKVVKIKELYFPFKLRLRKSVFGFQHHRGHVGPRMRTPPLVLPLPGMILRGFWFVWQT